MKTPVFSLARSVRSRSLLRGRLLAIGLHRVGLLGRGEPLDERMLRRDHHVGGAEERVGPGGVDPQHVASGRFVRPTRLGSRFRHRDTVVRRLAVWSVRDVPMKKSTSAPLLRPIQFRCSA